MQINPEKAPSKQVRLCFVGPSGSGKSSVVGCLTERLTALGLQVETLKLAQPLYDLQSAFYRQAGCDLAHGAQDQVLMETIARELRRIDPAALVKDFEHRLARCSADIVLNDDLRDDETDAPRLRAAGFRIVRIVTEDETRLRRLGDRNDLSSVAESPLDRQIARLPVDVVLNNSVPGMAQLTRQVHALADHIAAPLLRPALVRMA